MKTKKGGYLTLKIRLLNTRLFNRYLTADPRACYNAEQGKILSALWDHHPQTATELAQVTGLANSSLWNWQACCLDCWLWRLSADMEITD